MTSVILTGYIKVFHSGEFSSYSSYLTFLPEVGVGVWVGITGNKNGDESNFHHAITMYTLDVLLGELVNNSQSIIIIRVLKSNISFFKVSGSSSPLVVQYQRIMLQIQDYNMIDASSSLR